MKIVRTHNRHTGRTLKRNIIRFHKNSIDLSFPEYRTGKARFYFRPTLGIYANDYSAEHFYKTDIIEDKADEK